MSDPPLNTLAIIEPCAISRTGLSQLLKPICADLLIQQMLDVGSLSQVHIILVGPSHDAPSSLRMTRTITEYFEKQHIGYRPRIVIFSTFATTPLFDMDAMRSGAYGCIQLPITDTSKFLNQIQTVMRGQILFDASLISELKNVVAPTQREIDVLSRISQMKTNRVIADELNIDTRTVDRHVCNIIQKLHVSNRHEAVIRARHHGWIE
jgi:DNA-binding NarL/FixJ family response regulator